MAVRVHMVQVAGAEELELLEAEEGMAVLVLLLLHLGN